MAQATSSRPEKKKSRPPRTVPPKWINSEDRSRGSDSSKSGGRPSSVVLAKPLTRDLSDLSGSYLNGNSASKSKGSAVPPHIMPSDGSETSYQRPWRQAKVLSSREPVHPQPRQDDDDSVAANRKATVLMENNGVEVEVSKPQDVSISSSVELENRRAPVLLLLMDPQRKVYELMQLWIDMGEDTIREVLHAVQQNLESWRQDYDGIFQVRNNTFSQLIHILNVAKYDIQPYEVLVAKPWAMASKATVAYGMTLLHYLKQIGVLSVGTSGSVGRWQADGPRTDVWVLSKEARARVFVPDRVLKHYHACQFLTFSPPFEAMARVDVLGDGDESSLLTESQAALDSEADAHSDSKLSRNSKGSMARNRSFETTLKTNRTVFSNNRKVSDSQLVPPPPTKVRQKSLMQKLFGCMSKRRPIVDETPQGPSSETFLMETEAGGNMVWKVWEEETASQAAHSRTEESVVDDSAPLLKAPRVRARHWDQRAAPI